MCCRNRLWAEKMLASLQKVFHQGSQKWIEKTSFSNQKRRKKSWEGVISHGTISGTNEKGMQEGWGYKNLKGSLTKTPKNRLYLEAEHPSNCMKEWSGVNLLHKGSPWTKQGSSPCWNTSHWDVAWKDTAKSCLKSVTWWTGGKIAWNNLSAFQ